MASVGHVSLGIMYNQADRMRTWHRLHIYAHSLLLKRAPACTHDACKFSPAHQLVHSRHVSDGDMGAEAESACTQKQERTWTSLNLTHTFETVTFRFVCVCFFFKHLDTVYTHTHQQEVMSVPVTWETETVAKIPWQWVLVSELFPQPRFHMDSHR